MPKERSLEELKQILKNKYKENDKIERLFYRNNPLPLTGCYLDLALVEEKIINEKNALNFASEPIVSQDDLSSREYFLHEYERVEYIQKKLAVKAILAECKQAQKRIYIEGAAGAGKSTLSRYLANEWANDKAPWNQYEWVFYIRLRELTIENYPANLKNLLEVINGELFLGYGNRLNGREINNLFQALLNRPEKVLWILDGYDELNPAIVNYFWWEDLLASKFDLLVTSRPGALKNELCINLNLAVLGFNDEQVEKYIRNFFKYTPDVQTTDTAQCLALIKSNVNLKGLAHTPIQLELMCSIWEDLEKKQELPLTELYRVMLERLLKRRADREGISPKRATLPFLKKRYENYLAYMEYLAFLGMQSQQIILSEKQINQAYKILPAAALEQVDFQEQLEALGLIKVYNNGKQAEFAHLTFQEYFAARYVTKAIKAFSQDKIYGLSQEALLDFIGKTKWDNFYEVMWCFVAGLLSGRPNEDHQALEPYRFQNGDSNVNSSNTSEELTLPKSHQRLQTLQTFFDLLLQAPREGLEAFELPLLVSCLAEAGMPNIMQKEAIKLHFQKWLEFYWLTGKKELERSLLQKLVYVLKSSRELVGWAKPILLDLIKDKNPQMRRVAIETVSNLGASVNDELQKSLLPLLEDENSDTRCVVAFAVGNLGASANDELQKGLLLLLRDKDSQVRSAAAEAMDNLGASANDELQKGLLLLLRDKDSQVRSAAAKAIGNLGVSAIEVLQTGLLLLLQNKGENTWVRYAAAEAVGKLDASVIGELQKSLLPLLKDEDSHVRCAAAEMVGGLGASANDELQQGLLLLLQDEDTQVRSVVAKAMGNLSVSANDKLQQGLLVLLQDNNYKVRCAAALVVGNLGTSVTKELQQGLLPLLQDKGGGEVCYAAAKAVGNLGALANEALQKGLLMLLQDEDLQLRSAAAKAMGNLGTSVNEQLQKGLLSLLKDENSDTRCAAAEVVGNLGAAANDELQEGLLPLLKNENIFTRLAGTFAVSNLGILANNELRKGLLFLLQDENPLVRRAAAEVVGNLGALANDELQKGLLPLLQDKSSQVRWAVVEAVSNLGASANNELQQGLLALLQDKDCKVSGAAALGVGNLGVSAIEVLQKSLLALLEEKDAWVCSIVKSVLGRTKFGLAMVCQKTFKDHPLTIPLSIPPSRLIFSSKDIVKVDKHGKLDGLKLCGTVLQNLFQSNGSHNLTDTQWTLAIVRRKTPEAAASRSRCPNPFSYFYKSMQTLASHAFLILEGIKYGVRFAMKIDLYAVGGSGSQSSGQKVDIKITEIDNFIRLKELASNSCSMVHGISRTKAEQLLENIAQDRAKAQREEIVYSLSGDGSSSSNGAQQKHSCISWCIEKWQQAGLPLNRKWYDTAVVIPAAYLEEANLEEAKKTEGICLTM